MGSAQVALSVLAIQLPGVWRTDWCWGAPLIVLTVVIHVFGLGLLKQRVIRPFSEKTERQATWRFVVVMGSTTLLVTVLHGVEASIWAAVYRLLGALPDSGSAMLYSLEAITSYGHENVFLEKHWQLMGAIEALNGWLLFGLTTAFLFGVIQKVGLLGSWRNQQ